MTQSTKRYGPLHFPEMTTRATPDAGFWKLYPKTDGFYMLGADGNEVRLGAMVIKDSLTSFTGATIKFDTGFVVTQDTDGVIVSVDWSGTLPVHGNEGHNPNFATDSAFQAHLTATSPHGIDLSLLHTQNTDTKLDEGGANEVSASEIKSLVEANAGLVESAAQVVTGIYEASLFDRAVLANTSGGNVDIVLPEGGNNAVITFRKVGSLNAMTVTRSGTDTISFNGNTWTGITTDDLGTWFTLIKTSGVWYVASDSGLTGVNQAI